MPKRPRSSSITRHPDRLGIELARVRGLSLREIEQQYGVQKDAVARHMATLDRDYLAALAGDVPIAELAERAGKEGASVLDNLHVLQMTLSRAALKAEAAGDRHGQAALSRAWLDATRELAKFTGQMVSAPTIQNNVLNLTVFMRSPLMHRLQAMLETRLAAHPEAMAAVVAGLAELEGQTPQLPSPEVIDAAAA